ncbi:hypothetical protein [Roseateles sp.]|uniref:hypothetical protein n=1 Tax=Roseateles sp. TaxID=1971397 RepID=UPI003BA5F0D0
MLAKASILILAFVVLLALLAGLLSALRQLFFLRRSCAVRGTVIGEWRYLRFGRVMRYYRVEFQLANGQRAELRSQVTSSSSGPKLGQWVPVLIFERPGQGPRAKIGTWAELWFSSALLLATGGLGVLFLIFAAAQPG